MHKVFADILPEAQRPGAVNAYNSRTASGNHGWDAVHRVMTLIDWQEWVAHLGFTNDNLTAKNAVIPIVYWIYQSGIEKDINNPIRRKKDKIAIKKWLCVSLLKGIFSSGTDGVLTKIRNVLKDNSDTSIFPYDKIKDAFKDNPTKNFVFDDDFIHSLLGTQFNAKNCFLLLALIYMTSQPTK